MEEFNSCELQKHYMEEWNAYYLFWEKIAKNEPDLVRLISYSSLRANPLEVLLNIDDFVGVKREKPLMRVERVEKVKHSTPFSKRKEGVETLKYSESEGDLFDWRSYSS
ncbi:hypothetical protein GCM10025791_17510 [Halioxenophilus aromaticivorans]|uniref:Sulfotransferase domain-containing protein n=2 Tax=Halioxenophilus aromaticivorans TaxID=1306992 RepID=A0AAV3U1M1_9ALTE